MKFVRTISLSLPLLPRTNFTVCNSKLRCSLFLFFYPGNYAMKSIFPTATLNQVGGDGVEEREVAKKSYLFSFPFLPFSFLYQAQDDSIQLSRSNPGLIWHDTTALSSAQRRTIRSKLIVGPPQPAFLICGCAHDSVSASQMLSPLVSWYTDIDI